MNEKQPRKTFPTGALVLIFIGFVFLLNNFGIIPWSSWNFLWKLWPLIFIFMGLEVIFGSTKTGSTLVFVLTLVILIYIFLNLTGGLNGSTIKLPFFTPTPTHKPFMYRFNY